MKFSLEIFWSLTQLTLAGHLISLCCQASSLNLEDLSRMVTSLINWDFRLRKSILNHRRSHLDYNHFQELLLLENTDCLVLWRPTGQQRYSGQARRSIWMVRKAFCKQLTETKVEWNIREMSQKESCVRRYRRFLRADDFHLIVFNPFYLIEYSVQYSWECFNSLWHFSDYEGCSLIESLVELQNEDFASSNSHWVL